MESGTTSLVRWTTADLGIFDGDSEALLQADRLNACPEREPELRYCRTFPRVTEEHYRFLRIR